MPKRITTQELVNLLRKSGFLIGKPIAIKPTAENLTRSEEVSKYIQAVQKAHERTAHSTLRFDYQVYSAA